MEFYRFTERLFCLFRLICKRAVILWSNEYFRALKARSEYQFVGVRTDGYCHMDILRRDCRTLGYNEIKLVKEVGEEQEHLHLGEVFSKTGSLTCGRVKLQGIYIEK